MRDPYDADMKFHRLAIVLFAAFLALPAWARKFDWQTVEKIPQGTHIVVTTQYGTACVFQKATDDQLVCTIEFHGSDYQAQSADRAFNRADVRDVCVGEMAECTAFDESEGTPALMAAFEAGGGWDSVRQPTSFAGVKVGLGGITMDLQYDRLNTQSGFSVEGSGVFPVFRVPRYRPKNDRLFFRLYAEPGLGYRAGNGPFGQYASGKVLVLLGDKWVNDGASPYVELQRRFPFNAPLSGDNRIAFGIMWAVCEHCGLD